MTTKTLNVIKLPQPHYSLQLETNEPHAFSHIAQLIEVRKTGTTSPNQIDLNAKDLIGSSIEICNARPELFIRRDFISRFIDRGTVFIVSDRSTKYQLVSRGSNVLSIVLDGKQYRRFGIVAKRVISNERKQAKLYKIEVDLKDNKIITSNKFQDKLVQTLKRLDSLEKVYVRFIPNEKSGLSQDEATKLCLEYLNMVIAEYAIDGFKPVPLTSCQLLEAKSEKNWINFSQPHPALGLERFSCELATDKNLPDDPDKLRRLMDLVDWLGYQLLSLDCSSESIKSTYETCGEPVDVICNQLRGMFYRDFAHELLSRPRDNDQGGILLRAIVLYDCASHFETESASFLLQGTSTTSDKRSVGLRITSER